MRVLAIDDDRSQLLALASLVESEGFEVERASNLAHARGFLAKGEYDVVLCDLILPDGRGTELLTELAENARTEVILLTGNASIETAVEALRLGAFDYLVKPIDVARLTGLLNTVKRTARLKTEVSTLRRDLRELGRFGPMIGSSSAMQKVYDLIERVARTNASVLLVGESGTGKEVAAQAIHQMSARAHGPFVPVNCGAISQNLIESELFGHEKGSFTGAARQHLGVFERAHQGTLLLDEITEMPHELQVRLLRALETSLVTRVGGNKEIPVDVRVIAATNRRPEEAVRDGRLREDLYYRLAVFPIELPTLAARVGDVKLLAQHFLAEIGEDAGSKQYFTAEALEVLARHSWPGNVRELKNVVRRASIVAGDEIAREDLHLGLSLGAVDTGPMVKLRVPISLADAEKRLILATLELFDGDKQRTADTLGVSLKTIYNRLNAYADESEGGEANEARAGQ